MAKPKPSPWSWISLGLALVALAGTTFSLLIVNGVIDLSPAPTHVPAPTAQPAPLDLPAKLITAGYHFDHEREDEGMNARRPVHSQWWTRSNAPQMIVISDDVSPTVGDFKINSIIYDGTDGKGHLTCSPKDSTSTALSALLADAAAVQGSLNDNSKPGRYSSSLVTCLR